MFVRVVALRSQHYTTLCCVVLRMECHNSHKHSQSFLTTKKNKVIAGGKVTTSSVS